MNTDGILLYMPVDHHPATFVASVPLGHQILVPGAELLGVRGAGGGGLTPNVGQPDAKDSIGHIANRLRKRRFRDKLTLDLAQIRGADAMLTVRNSLNAEISSCCVETKQQPLAQLLRGKCFTVACTLEVLSKLKPHFRLLQHIK